MGGEKVQTLLYTDVQKGSPPRMRGKAGIPVTSGGNYRITPACAGKRRTPKQCVFNSRDHPRVCGEKCTNADRAGRTARITPAYAGKRWYTRCAKKLPPDHPRVCGEKSLSLVNAVLSWGSPPRMRGKDWWRFCRRSVTRITPAHAGKSLRSLTVWRGLRDHPRACRAKSYETSECSPKQGSPPRMRGKELFFEHCLFSQRITPAHAGKRYDIKANSAGNQDHPRACGEKK